VEGVLDMGIQLAEALAFVHKRKIYHRDLKPTNVLVRPDGRPMLLDFNLSFDEQAAQQTLGGTLIYMAPEMLRVIAEKNAGPGLLDARTDLYSLGVILYEMLSGEHPFEEVLWSKSAADNRQRLAELQKTGLRPLRAANPQVDKKVAEVVDRCLAYDPRERFQSAAELARTLRQCLSGPQRWRRRLARHPFAVFGAGLAAVLLAVVVTVFLAVREPYPQREFKAGLSAFEQGQYGEAIDHLSRSLDAEESPQAYLARGRAFMKVGKANAALDDFTLADKLEPTGQTQAALAYCYFKLVNYPSAVSCYKEAIQRGFKTAVVYNNLGWALMCMKKGTDAEAAQCFRKATQADPHLQIAYHNHATLEMRKAWKHLDPFGYDDLREGMAAMAKAIDLGPATAYMHLDAARLYALAKKIEPRWQELALDHLAAALDRGLPPSQLKDDGILIPLHGAQFNQLTEWPAVSPAATPSVRVLDPLEGS
jgi:tetratricopeptide (TPR) repeat protein